MVEAAVGWDWEREERAVGGWAERVERVDWAVGVGDGARAEASGCLVGWVVQVGALEVREVGKAGRGETAVRAAAGAEVEALAGGAAWEAAAGQAGAAEGRAVAAAVGWAVAVRAR